MTSPDSTPPSRIAVRWNRHTCALAAALVAMWYAAAAQSNGAVYLLTFACAGMAMLSWLHARANLRDIDVQTGDLVLNQRAGCYRLPFRLLAKSRRAASGIEIAAARTKTSVFAGQLEPGVPFRSELMIPSVGFDAAAPLTLLIRSLYPLGFFTAELRIPLTQSKKVAPFPQGSLPLPAPVKTASTAHTGSAAAGALGVSGNDDFAGVRSWQPGDSPRHIDWKAVARDRPLMTKQWTGNQNVIVKLDWNALQLDDDAKASQLAKWMHDCEAQGLSYSLQLPDRSIPSGIGPRHLHQCLEALGGMLHGNVIQGTKTTGEQIPFSHETSPLTSAAPRWIMSAALLLTLPPMFDEVSWLAMFLLAMAVAFRLIGGWLASPLARLLFVLAGGWLVYATETEHRSMEAATAMLLVFIGAKFIESRSPRDFQIVALLGWFLCMCGLSLEQSLIWSLYTTGVFLFISAALVRLRRGARQMKSSGGAALALMTQALPVMVLMFLFFPRGNEDFVARLARRNAGRSGLSANLEPGSVAKVALSDKVSFRAEISGDRALAPRERYWRCMVLWDCNGLVWRRGGGARSISTPTPKDAVRQMIAIEPHGNYWLPALDRPFAIGPNATGSQMGDDDTVMSIDSVDSARRYTVLSSPGQPPSLLNDVQRSRALRVPQNISGHVENLANSFRHSEDDSDEAVVQNALAYLRAQGFKYTLEPGEYEANGLEDFLLNRRLGFCEHFSAAFATLMRLAGIPSRIVVGYLGGEYSDSGGYWIIRQSDAHAWTEVWLKNKGWTRIDPTAELNPTRLTSTLEESLAGADSGFSIDRQSFWWRAWTESRLLWDRLDYEWYNRVVSADEQAQMDTLASLGLSNVRWTVLLSALGTGIGLTAFVVFLWLKRSVRHPDPAARLWLRVCRKLEKAGLSRQPGEGASAFAMRAAARFPKAASSLLRVSDCYNAVRYGSGQSSLSDLKDAIGKVGPLR